MCRWAESHRKWPDGKPWYEDPYGALWVGACIPEDQQARMKKWKEQVRHAFECNIELTFEFKGLQLVRLAAQSTVAYAVPLVALAPPLPSI